MSSSLPPASGRARFLSGKNLFRMISLVYPYINMFLKCHIACLFGVLLVNALLVQEAASLGEVLWAVNAGGDGHTDIHGIRYQKDHLTTGIASDYGKSLNIHRVVPQDAILYQTERYHTGTFGYEFPIKGDGDYVLVAKFSEVWFTAPNQKVFNIILNGAHTVVEELDIFGKVGRGVAHDEIIPFTVKNGRIRYDGESSSVESNKVSIKFAKLDRDNPKVNALYVMKGTVEDVPMLPPMPGADRRTEDDTYEDEEDEEMEKPKKSKTKPSGPRAPDPYASDDTGSMMLPIFVAIGAFIPLLFCLCKL